jgi:N-acyl homoserine lactone hydrolase
MLELSDIRRMRMGHFTAPSDHPLAGKHIVVDAFLVRHSRGRFLFDTGIGEGDEGAERRYRPVRRPLRQALAEAGARLEDVRYVANCHLHFDHAGGNHLFPKVPNFVQRVELATARAGDYTVPGPVFDFAGARLEELDGESEVLPGLRLVPTPGHTEGHQSLVVSTRQGRVILAGQAFTTATEYGIAHYERGLPDRPGDSPQWLERFAELDPALVLFAHDLMAWQRAV